MKTDNVIVCDDLLAKFGHNVYSMPSEAPIECFFGLLISKFAQCPACSLLSMYELLPRRQHMANPIVNI